MMKPNIQSLTVLLIFVSTIAYSQNEGTDYGAVYDAAFSHDGSKIATATSMGLQIWNADPFELIEEVEQENGFLVLKWSRDDSQVFASQLHLTFERLFITYNINTKSSLLFPDKVLKWLFYDNGSRIIRPLVHNSMVNFSQNSDFLATVNNNNSIEIYSLENSETIFQKAYDEPDIPYSIHYTNDESIIAIGLSENRIQFIDLNTEEVVNDVQLEQEPELQLGGSLSHTSFKLFEMTSDMKYAISLTEHTSSQLGIAYRYVTSIYDTSTSSYLFDIGVSTYFTDVLRVFGYPIRHFYNPSTETMYIFDEEPIRLFDLKTGEESEIEGFNPGEFTTYFAQPFSPDGTKVLSDDYKAIVKIPLGNGIAEIRNPEPKGPDLFLNDLVTGEKVRLLPLPAAVKNYESYE